MTWAACLPRWRRELTRIRRRIATAPTAAETERSQARQLVAEVDELILSLNEMIHPDEVDDELDDETAP